MNDRPPFRADHVGSFLRPPEVTTARRQREEGKIDAADLRRVEDEAIAELVKREEKVGLRGITDGELRRFMFHVDFLEQLSGVTVTEGQFLAKFRRDDGTEIEFKPPTMLVDAPIKHTHSVQGRDFDFLVSQVSRTPKVCIPAPSMLHFRGGRKAISEEVYPRLDQFFDDLTAAYREEIADLAGRGCTYVQMDDTNLAYLCDPEIRERTAARGDDPDDLTRLYCRLVNDAFRDKPDEMVAAIHLCRGNFQSAWVSQGGYDPVAEILFNEMAVDAFFLEYDDERSGDFAPLRFVPKGKKVVLGLMSSKHSRVEDADEIKQRIEEAASYLPLDQLALSHQCGFSSTVHGNAIEPEDQWRKLAQTVAVASEVWGYTA
jgi:5-methyltetrahydropteroyltriglutamate--homocysteine methyltransferase